MKILHVVQSLDPAQGGPPAVAIRLAAAQSACGCQVVIASYDNSASAGEIDAAMASVPGIGGITFAKCARDRFAERLFASGAKAGLNEHAAGMDVLHLHGVWDPILRVAADTARSKGAMYVVTPHGMLDPWSLTQKPWKKTIALRLGYRRMLNDAAFLHALNEDESLLIKPMGLTCPVRILPNGLFLQELDAVPPRGTFYSKHPELGGRPYVLFLGRLHHKKGLDHLIEAFHLVAQSCPDAALVVAGPDGGALHKLSSDILRLGLSDRVHVVGPLFGQDKLAALADAAVFCLPSRQEGFSIAILEALGCGIPVVISKSCHFPEVSDVGAGEVVELSADQISRALVRYVREPVQRRQAGEAAQRLVRSRYTWPSIAKLSINLYEEHLVRPQN